MRLVFVHGWAMDADVFRPLRQVLALEDTFGVDLGFVNEPRPRIPFKSQPFVAVGHSLGVLWLLGQEGLNLKGLIAINGFTRFSEAPGFPSGVGARVLKRMQTGLKRDAAQVVGDFRNRIGATPSIPEHLDKDRLTAGLNWLETWDHREAFTRLAVPTLILAGRQDPIVPPAMTSDCFPEKAIEWATDGGHLLPLTHTEWCKLRVEAFLRDLP